MIFSLDLFIYFVLLNLLSFLWIIGKLASKLYGNMRREAASIRIPTKIKGHHWQMSYKKFRISVVVIETGIRVMAYHKEFRQKR